MALIFFSLHETPVGPVGLRALRAARSSNQDFEFALGGYAPGANFNLVLIFEIVYNLRHPATVVWPIKTRRLAWFRKHYTLQGSQNEI